jgi:hypothetical protein
LGGAGGRTIPELRLHSNGMKSWAFGRRVPGRCGKIYASSVGAPRRSIFANGADNAHLAHLAARAPARVERSYDIEMQIPL